MVEISFRAARGDGEFSLGCSAGRLNRQRWLHPKIGGTGRFQAVKWLCLKSPKCAIQRPAKDRGMPVWLLI